VLTLEVPDCLWELVEAVLRAPQATSAHWASQLAMDITAESTTCKERCHNE